MSDDDRSDDNEKALSSKKKKLKKNPHSPNKDENDNDNNNNNGADGSNDSAKPMLMETLPMDLVENRIWSYLTIDDFYRFAYSSQAMKEYVQEYAKRQGKLETNDIHKEKWLCKDCNCNLFSVKRPIHRDNNNKKKKNIPENEKEGNEIYEKIILLAPYACNCKCGGDGDDDPNCRWMCYNCSAERECNICGKETVNYCKECTDNDENDKPYCNVFGCEIANYCKECLFQLQCNSCSSFLCSECFDTEMTVCYSCGGMRFCSSCLRFGSDCPMCGLDMNKKKKKTKQPTTTIIDNRHRGGKQLRPPSPAGTSSEDGNY